MRASPTFQYTGESEFLWRTDGQVSLSLLVPLDVAQDKSVAFRPSHPFDLAKWNRFMRRGLHPVWQEFRKANPCKDQQGAGPGAEAEPLT